MSSYPNLLTDDSPQLEVVESESFGEGFSPSVLSESEEIELTSELLEINNEEQLDHSLGDLVIKAVGKFIQSPVGKAIGGVLKGVAKYGLPVAAGAVGSIFGGPVGGMLGAAWRRP
jgi:hypothetical protein